MENKQLKQILDDHALWLAVAGGQRADLRLADLQRADLRGAILQGADLQGADLQRADLRWANLQRADLQRADLRGANLRGANLDFSSLPLWCGGLDMVVDNKIQYQILFHAYKQSNLEQDPDLRALFESEIFMKCVRKFHRWHECE